MDELYTSNPDGLCGNEDCGQMSAWYVLSAMGFYPVTPGSNIYTIGSPIFEKVKLKLENGKEFIIEARDLTDENIYVKTASLNEHVYPKSYITHQTIMDGGLLRFEMSNSPNMNWGAGEGDYPVSEITEPLITPVPFVKAGDKVFFDEQTIELGCAEQDARILYRAEGNTMSIQFHEYNKPLEFAASTKVTALAKKKGQENSFDMEAIFLKIPKGRKISIKNTYANQYNAGGDVALIDFQRGGNNFRTGNWQGYEGVDLEAVIDLGANKRMTKLKTGFLQDINAWIFMPEWVEYYMSMDGKEFVLIGKVENDVAEDDWTVTTKNFTLSFYPKSFRYIKVIAKNRGVCPESHKGAGNPAWIFADEVVIK
jgi:hypothetical protein